MCWREGEGGSGGRRRGVKWEEKSSGVRGGETGERNRREEMKNEISRNDIREGKDDGEEEEVKDG